jgi:UDP-N-acetylglucosamine 1-carboxyvinyltransferase
MTSTFHVRGGHPLDGEISVRGAKNLVSKAMVAALLGDEPSTLRSVPQISDVHIVSELLKVHGVKVALDHETGVLEMDPKNVERAHAVEIDAHAGSSRIPILFCGPLLHRLGEAVIPDLGGCRIGDRPIYLRAEQRLRGTEITLKYPSVGATEQVLLAAVRAEGFTELKNAAVEPEIEDLIAVLQKMGAIISIQTDRTITIEGVDRLGGYDHVAIPDRIEAASWACAALVTRGSVFVRGAQQKPMSTFLNIFRKIGGGIEIREEGIRFFHPGTPLRATVVETNVHPGFMTDWQQPLVVALTQADGISIVHETVYENRLGFTRALNEMGARIQVYRECLGGAQCRFGVGNYQHSAVISGPKPLRAADITVPDLRGGFSYLIAALGAEGVSHIHGIDLIDRGYEQFREKLNALGADYWED